MLGIAFITPEEGVHQPGGDQETQPLVSLQNALCRPGFPPLLQRVAFLGLFTPDSQTYSGAGLLKGCNLPF